MRRRPRAIAHAIRNARSIRATAIFSFTTRPTGATRQITNTEDAETNPHFTHDEKRVAFTRGNNLYVIELATGAMAELSDIRPAGTPPPPEDEKGTASQEALKKDQKDLFDVIRERAAEREEQEAKRKREHPRKPFILQAGPNRSVVAAHAGREVRNRDHSRGGERRQTNRWCRSS